VPTQMTLYVASAWADTRGIADRLWLACRRGTRRVGACWDHRDLVGLHARGDVVGPSAPSECERREPASEVGASRRVEASVGPGWRVGCWRRWLQRRRLGWRRWRRRRWLTVCDTHRQVHVVQSRHERLLGLRREDWMPPRRPRLCAASAPARPSGTSPRRASDLPAPPTAPLRTACFRGPFGRGCRAMAA
jgi:hypothetical protein